MAATIESDPFNTGSDPIFQNQVERRLAADIAGAFDRNYQAAQRNISRYNQTPDLTNDWGIERARTTIDAINRNRINDRNLAEQQRLANERNAAIAASRPQSVGSANNRALEDLLNQLRNPAGRNLNQARTNGLTSGLQGLAQFLPFLLGQDQYSQLMRGGLFGLGRDLFGRDMLGSTYPNTPMPNLVNNAPIPPTTWVDDVDNYDLMGTYDPEIDYMGLGNIDLSDLFG